MKKRRDKVRSAPLLDEHQARLLHGLCHTQHVGATEATALRSFGSDVDIWILLALWSPVKCHSTEHEI